MKATEIVAFNMFECSGKRIKTSKTFEKEKDAQIALKNFEADKIKHNLVFPSVLTVEN